MEIRPILSALLRNKTAPLLVAMQVALSLALLTNALYIIDLRQAGSQRPSGIEDENSVFRIEVRRLKDAAFAQKMANQQNAKEALQAIPGVRSVASINQMPLTQSGSMSSLATDRKQKTSITGASGYYSGDSIIQTLGLKLTQGRDFTPGDILEVDTSVSDTSPNVVIITEGLAQKLYPGAASVIGKPLLFGTGDKADEARIIGVVARLQTPFGETGLEADYSTILPLRTARGGSDFVVRTEPGQLDQVMGQAEAALRKAAAEPVIVSSASVKADRIKRYKKDHALAWMLGVVSGLLLLITISGVVGMTTLWVAQRRKQIGVRRALGATRADILRYFVTENILITSGGIGLGVVLALGLNQVLVSQIEMSKLPVSFLLLGAGVLLGLGVGAVGGPALRASGLSPAIATRSV